MTLKIKVNDSHFQYQPKVSHDACFGHIWWIQLKSVMSYHANKFTKIQKEWQTDGQTDGQTEETVLFHNWDSYHAKQNFHIATAPLYLIQIKLKPVVSQQFWFSTVCKKVCGWTTLSGSYSLQWRHNEHDGISNHQPHNCLLNHLFRHRWMKTLKLCVTGLWEGNSLVTGEFLAQRVCNAKMFPLDDVIMWHKFSHPLQLFPALSHTCSLHQLIEHADFISDLISWILHATRKEMLNGHPTWSEWKYS